MPVKVEFFGPASILFREIWDKQFKQFLQDTINYEEKGIPYPDKRPPNEETDKIIDWLDSLK